MPNINECYNNITTYCASLNIISIYNTVYTAPLRHIHTSYYPSHHCVIYTLKGSGRIVLANGETAELTENTVYINKFINIRMLECTQGEWHFHIIWFQPSGFSLPLNVSIDVNFPDEEEFITELIRLVKVPQPSETISNFNLFKANCMLLNRISEYLTIYNEKHPTIHESKMDEVINYINNHLDSPLNLTALASQFNYSEKQFRRLLLKKTGLLPKKYISSIKMKKACELLSLTDYTVEYVALSLGFTSIPQFMSTFKKVYKKTPTQFRNSQTNK